MDNQEFRITDDAAADWLLKQYSCIDAEIALIQAQAAAAVTRLKSDRENLERLYQSELEEYTRQRLQGEKRGRKSVILPHGTVQFRKVPAGLKVVDPAAALLYAQDHCPDVVLNAPHLDAAHYRELAQNALNSTGEILPGVEYVGERESFSIKFGKEG